MQPPPQSTLGHFHKLKNNTKNSHTLYYSLAPHFLPLATMNLFFCLSRFPCSYNGNRKYVVCRVWLRGFEVTCTIACVRTSFPVWLHLFRAVVRYSSFIRSSVVSICWLLGLMRAKCLCGQWCSCLWSACPALGPLGPVVILLTGLRDRQTFPPWLIHFIFQQSGRVLISPHPCQCLLFSFLKISYSHPLGIKWYLTVVSICLSWMTYPAEQLFMCCLAFVFLLWRNASSDSLPVF